MVESGRASWRCGPTLQTSTPANFVIIMKAVGRSVGFLSYPGKGIPVLSTCARICRSISRHSSSASNNTNPKASIELFRNKS